MRIVSRAAVLSATGLMLLVNTAAPGLVAGRAFAQAASVTQVAPKALFIEVIEGEGELNDVRARTAREPIVQVEDENHKPVAGALVLFSIDTNGGSPLASFSGARSVAVRTGADGRASASGYQTTSLTGQVRILVHVTIAAAVADAVINQTNFAKNSRFTRTFSQHKGVLGAAAALGGVAALILFETRGSGTTITAGNGVVRP